MHDNVYQRVEQLMSQRRFDEAILFLKNHLTDHPEDYTSIFLLSNVYLAKGDGAMAKTLIYQLNEISPDNPQLLQMLAEIDIQNELYADAEEKIQMLIQEYPNNPDLFAMLARMKFMQRNYDKSLFYAETALSLDPEHTSALNIRLTTSSLLGKSEISEATIAEALQQNPDSPGTIANQAMHMLRQGNVIDSLERSKYALSLDPNNELAKYVMAEAMKSKFWPYKLFFILQQKMALLSGNQAWLVIIGGYIGLRLLSRAAEKNPSLQPFLYPLIFLVALLFLSTWILTPLMNAYLLTNKYGKYLLDVEDKKMAQFTIGTIAISLLCLLLYFLTNISVFFLAALLFSSILFL